MKDLIITVDGHSSCGKSTLAQDIAQALNYLYVDSGAMYRAITLYLIRYGAISSHYIDYEKIKQLLDDIDIRFTYNPEKGVSETLLNHENVEQAIRSMEVNTHVSTISKIKAVREKLVEMQKTLGTDRRLVMDGRDIGTVVFPDADIKIFLTADLEIRAQRRYEELLAKQGYADFEEIRANLEQRDYVDAHREESPLIQPKDAFVLDNSHLNRQQQLRTVLNWIYESQQFDEG